MVTPLFSVGGLASGLDTDAIVKQLMQLERAPIVRLQQRQAAYRARVDAWATLRTRLSALRTAVNAVRSADDLRSLVQATSSDPSVVQAAATGAADPGTLAFTVDQLATRHQVIAQGSFVGSGAMVGAGTLTIVRGNSTYEVTTGSGTTLAGLAAAINGLGAGVRASVVAVDGTNVRLVLSAEQSGSAAAFTVSATQAGLGPFDVLEQGLDARVRIGSGSGALTLTRPSNTIDDLIPGVSLTLKGTGSAAVTVDRDVEGAVAGVRRLVEELNKTLTTIASLTRYDPESKSAGPLQGDPTAWRLQVGLRAAFSDAVLGLTGGYRALSQVGITLTREGTFALDGSSLRTALREDPAAVDQLLGRWGRATDARLAFAGATDQTRAGAYDVVITRAAEVPSVTGSPYTAPGADLVFGISAGGASATVTVSAGTELQGAVSAINDQLRSAGVSTVVASVADGDRIRLSGTRFGSGSSFEVTGSGALGLDGSFVGVDVAGTIGGLAASGSGQVLAGSTGSAAGLRVRVTARPEDVAAAGGSLGLGTITYVEGAVGRLSRALAGAEGAGGLVGAASDRWRAQIRLIDEEVRVFERRLELRETELRRRFTALESTMSSLTAQANWLAAQLATWTGRAGS